MFFFHARIANCRNARNVNPHANHFARFEKEPTCKNV
jgi:hypothetical protein